MSAFNKDLAEWAKALVGGLSYRQVEIRTGVSYATVPNVLVGRKVGAETIIKFAVGFDADVGEALRLAGYNEISDIWETGAYQKPPEEEPEPVNEKKFTEDEQEMITYYRGSPPELKPAVRAMLREIYVKSDDAE